MSRLRSRDLRRALKLTPADGDESAAAEIFSVERLEQYAQTLARSQEVSPLPSTGVSLQARLRDNTAILNAAHKSLIAGIRNTQSVMPAAEWLVDNYYVVDEHIQAIRRDLPAGYYKQLPKIANGPWLGYPRVYGLARAIITHTDNHFELDTLLRFCRAYQRVQPLTIGELWAVAISLRVVLIDNLARMASGIVHRVSLRARADALADELLRDESTPASPAAVLRKIDADHLPPAFAAQLFQRLRDQDPRTTPALAWLQSTLAAQKTTADDIVHSAQRRQGAVNVSVRNVITSLKLISSVDWAEFFENVSLVDTLLREQSLFGTYDFPTRDLYRHAVEDLARGSGRTEMAVAARALDAARRAGTPREAEAGYHLVSAGRPALERELGYRIPWSQRIARGTRAAGIAGYVGCVTGLAAAATALCCLWAGMPQSLPLLSAATLALIFLTMTDFATTLANLWVTHFCKPELLPGLELLEGVPAELRSIVAVPVLLTSLADIEAQVRSLEVHYLATQDGDIHFALLSDWRDAAAETVDDDAGLLAAAAVGVARLNRAHGSVRGDARFLLLHRRRQWNPGEGCWMGWERKRGKLHEFNQLLLGAQGTSFLAVDGAPPRVPAGVRFVISLDGDTRLPRGAALALIGKMAHPLNLPQIETEQRRVVSGYGILQPRVTPSLPTGLEASRYQSLLSGPSGIDPYAFAVSDVYQDMFGEGSYTGKGIYDVAVFETTLAGRVGENRLLSHDLFEGLHARCGLASDVEVVEEYPSRYDVADARLHRWTRGDWQLLPWILKRGINLGPLSRWKMLDNLRRSLIASAGLAALVLVWTGRAPLAWTLLLLGAMLLPVLAPMGLRLAPRARDLLSPSYFSTARTDIRQSAAVLAMRLAFWADHACVMTDAMGRALFRMLLSHRHLLEWTTTAQSKIGASLRLARFYRRMSGGVLLAVGIGALLAAVQPPALWIAAPLLLAWLGAPALARWVSLPVPTTRMEPLTTADAGSLRRMARQTWSFFDSFVTAEHNALPPDNFQEAPNAVVANRTSPTNMGLYLLSIVSAREFGWIGALEAIERLEATFATFDRLERFRGHFYNWYDTRDLRPLDPQYVSTVDSGNLAGHFLALAGALRAWRKRPAVAGECLAGIEDALVELRQTAAALDDERRNYGVSPRQLTAAMDALQASLRAGMTTGSMATGGMATSGMATGGPATGGPATGGPATGGPAGALTALLPQAGNIVDIVQALVDERQAGSTAPLVRWAAALRDNVASHLRDALADDACLSRLDARREALAQRARSFAMAMEFDFLVEQDRQLLSIGYRVAERAQDPSCYDLLASEARLASFIAIAKGDLPVRHWFRLGRLLTPVGRGSALVSWSGSMFEYLMPVLVMREPDGSVLGDSARAIVRRQIEFGDERGLPWGVSESAFNARDRELTYQYSSFGIPGLGLQRGLGAEAVVAPYATALAAMIDPKAAVRNFARLETLGGHGSFGWYDALDFTPARVPEGQTVAPVLAYMAHHQGMILVSMANVLLHNVMRAHFHADSMVESTELLLQERTPRNSDLAAPGLRDAQSVPELRDLATAVPRRFTSPHHVAPRTHLLSNGAYSVMITAAGSGYSRWRDTAVTRWREDPTLDAWGSYVFLRDVANGQVWSAGYQPVGREPDSYEVAFYEDRAEIVRKDGPVVTCTEFLVSPEDDAEVRKVSITNTGNRVREIELTTYAEVVLSPPEADSAHPAFSKMFVQTEFVPEAGVLLATRRGREPTEPQMWAAHVSVLEGEAVGGLQFETDRARFLGRGHDLRNAVSIVDARPLSNTAGTVLDPVLSLRRRVRIAPGGTARVAFWTAVAHSRDLALSLADKHRDVAAFDRAKTLAWTQAQVQLRYLGVDFDEAQQFQRIANRVLYSDSSLRASRDILGRNQLGPQALWTHGVSGDLPIVLIRIDDEDDLEIVKQLLRAHEYWRLKRLAVDLVILNDRPPSYASDLQQAIESAVRTSLARGRDEQGAGRGAVFSLRGDLLQTAARAVFVARRGTLDDQLARLREAEPVPREQVAATAAAARPAAPRSAPALEFFNGLGGFAAAGREYVTILEEGQWTPAPWINVIANPRFGFQVSADGSGSTWSQNARENQLTPWSNDPVSDTPAEVIYLRDEDSGELWSATPLPIREPAFSYVVRHGFGYTRFEHASHGIGLELLQFVPLDATIKISRLKLTNRSATTRLLSITYFLDWVLGNQRSKTAPFIVTEIEPGTAALLARNPWRTEFQSHVAFMDMAGRQQGCTADRAEFIGRHGTLAEPAALVGGLRLTNRVGGGLDPCGALQGSVSLRPGEQTEFVFLLGEEGSREAAMASIERYRTADLDQVLKTVTDFWDRTLGTLQVKTPDRSIDVLLNGWLLYQTLVCRIWARTGFYQSSGAYGFRDQLQDVMAVCVAHPALAREHILRAAARQFEAGDVQHWWLPTSGQGVKTRVSDDRIWLPFVIEHYLGVTEDFGLLDEQLPFLEGGPLQPAEQETFAAPPPTPGTASLFEHCVRALDSSLAIGSHGLPLFGTGDWNDGMNRVGAAGRGESVWLGWFLHSTLLKFAPLAERRRDAVKASVWRRHAFALQQAIEREAWDGDWYRRGYFDDGTPLGSISSEECRIDSIAQSWAVISGAADPARAARAMSAVNTQLVSRSDGLVKLFTPAFERSQPDPGYIQAYPAGLRENGGQYTHAAMWTTLAFVLQGDGDRAAELFSLLNPINHASTRAGIHRYKVEPYVVCADVYSAPGHVGRGGWTWYTGSAGWMYRTGVEGILGIQVRGTILSIDPCIPRAWPAFEITFKHGSSRYRVAVENPHGVSRGIVRAMLDDREISRTACEITLVDDGAYHYARITMGVSATVPAASAGNGTR